MCTVYRMRTLIKAQRLLFWWSSTDQGASQHQGFSASQRCFCRSLASTPFGQTRKRSCASLASGHGVCFFWSFGVDDRSTWSTTTVDIAGGWFLKAWAHESRKFGLSHMIITYHPSFCILSPQDELNSICPSRSRPLAPVSPGFAAGFWQRSKVGGYRGWRVEALDTGHPTKVGSATVLAYVYKLEVYKYVQDEFLVKLWGMVGIYIIYWSRIPHMYLKRQQCTVRSMMLFTSPSAQISRIKSVLLDSDSVIPVGQTTALIH